MSSVVASNLAKKLAITLGRSGCKNRPFYNIIVAEQKGRKWEGDIIENIGSFDPIPNEDNEKLVAINFLRLKYWLSRENVLVSNPVLQLLGLAGYLPVHPLSYVGARKTRAKIATLNEQLKEAQAALLKNSENSTDVESAQN